MQLNACQDALGKCFVQALVGSGLGTEAHFIVQGRSRRRNSIHQLVFRRLEKSFLLLAWSLYCFQKSGRARVAGEAGKPKNQGREFPVRLLGQLGACVGGQEFFGDRCCTTCLGAVLLSPKHPFQSIRHGACNGVQHANVPVVIGQSSRHHSMLVCSQHESKPISWHCASIALAAVFCPMFQPVKLLQRVLASS